MDARLMNLIRDFQRKVAQAVSMLESAGIARPLSNIAWASADFPKRGPMPGGFTFYPHGFGCAIRCQDWSVDFDFGDAGEIDGFDEGRLCSFGGKRLADYGFKSEDEIRLSYRQATEVGDLMPSRTLSYLRERQGNNDEGAG